jgi:hypothetical protein
MARPRVNQFADDLGISRREALSLIEKGRRRKDGGSAVLENSMNKMKGYENGGSNSVPLPKKKPPEPLHEGRRQPKEEKPFKLTEEEEREMMGSTLSDYRNSMEEKAMGGSMKVKGYSGGGMNCRGGGAAIQGTKFSGDY